MLGKRMSMGAEDFLKLHYQRAKAGEAKIKGVRPIILGDHLLKLAVGLSVDAAQELKNWLAAPWLPLLPDGGGHCPLLARPARALAPLMPHA